MKIKTTLLCVIIWLMAKPEMCFAQNSDRQISLATMPAYVRELQQGPPPQEMMYREPDLYQHLMKRRTVLAGILQKAVNENRLPKNVLNVLHATERSYIDHGSTPNIQNVVTGDFHLVKDIDTITNSNPSNSGNTYTTAFAVLQGIIYYSADDGVHGVELWRSDGTSKGTYMVKDINPGSVSGGAHNITEFKGKIYFTASADETGTELYQSNGTAEGTVVLKDISQGPAGSYPSNLTKANGELYFTLNYSHQIWKTDGTTNGTIMAADLSAISSYSSNVSHLSYAKNLLFFTTYNITTGGIELWRSDGTQNATYIIKNFSYLNAGAPTNLTAYNNLLYFSNSGNDNYHRTLWRTDGTAAGTYMVDSLNTADIQNLDSWAFDPLDQPFAIAQNSLFFAARNNATGVDLYKYNAFDKKGITLVKNISSNAVGLTLTTEGIRSLNDTIYFVMPSSESNKYNLWKSAGKSTDTKIVKALPGYVGPYNFYVTNNSLYFSAASANGYEPWTSDGTSIGTKQLADINPGPLDSDPNNFTFCNNKVYYSAASTNGRELWIINPNQITRQVKDINTTATESGVFISSTTNAVALNANELIFMAYQPSSGDELWKSDGTNAGTSLVKDVVPGPISLFPVIADSKNGKVYFYGNSSDNQGTEDIYYTDGSAAGTKKLASTSNGYYVTDIKAADNGIVFYTTSDSKLWRTDSTGINILLYSNVSEMGVAADVCYFSGFTVQYGYELWKSDGTIQGTNMVKDILSGDFDSRPRNFVSLNNKIIFEADSDFGTNLFVSNGTEKGTKRLSGPNQYTQLNRGTAILKSDLYYGAKDYNNSFAIGLYKTDGTVDGTVLVKNTDEFPDNLTTSGNLVYFSTDYTDSIVLWKTNGTKKNTQPIKNLSLNGQIAYVTNFTSAADKLFFLNNDSLWVSDGTNLGTQMVADAGLNGLSYIGYIVGLGNKLFLNGTTYSFGSELYEEDASLRTLNYTNSVSKKTVNTSNINAQVAVNPFSNNLKININAASNQQLKIKVFNVGGQQMFNQIIDVNEGLNFDIFNSVNWLPGEYLINIVSNTGVITLKAVK